MIDSVVEGPFDGYKRAANPSTFSSCIYEIVFPNIGMTWNVVKLMDSRVYDFFQN